MQTSNAVPHGNIGAGGFWSVQNERADPSVIVQFNEEHCFAACVSTILRDRGIVVLQQTIASEVGVPTPWSKKITKSLNSHDPDLIWTGKGWDPDDLELAWTYLGRRVPWIALFKDFGNHLMHAVIVDGSDEQGRWQIRDPWAPGTRYVMLPHAVRDPRHGWTGLATYPLRHKKQNPRNVPNHL